MIRRRDECVGVDPAQIAQVPRSGEIGLPRRHVGLRRLRGRLAERRDAPGRRGTHHDTLGDWIPEVPAHVRLSVVPAAILGDVVVHLGRIVRRVAVGVGERLTQVVRAVRVRIDERLRVVPDPVRVRVGKRLREDLRVGKWASTLHSARRGAPIRFRGRG